MFRPHATRTGSLLVLGLLASCGSSGTAPGAADASGTEASLDGAHDGGHRDGAAHDGSMRDGDALHDGSPVDGASPRDTGVDAFGGSCAPERVASCSCASGIGTRRCFADGTAWGPCTCASYGAQFYVSPTGSDSAAGTLAAPFLTLERAQTAVRALREGGIPSGGAVVWLRGGVYERHSTFQLDARDSGSSGSPVVYRGYPGETARLVGGTRIAPSSFAPVTSSSSVWTRLDPTAQGVVVAADLKALGITDFGTLSPRGSGYGGAASALELFIDGVRQPLGRWPDLDSTDPAVTYGFSSIASVASSTVFTLAENRTTRWGHAPDPWVLGFFAFTWADNSLPVTAVDPATGTVTLGVAPGYGTTNPIQGAGAPPLFAFNLLEELTEPGEWYLDRTSGLLYLWPSAQLAQQELVVSLLSTPLVGVSGVSNLTLQELTLEATRTELLSVSGASSHVQVVGCTLRDSGDRAASIADGSDNVFDGNLVYDTGEGGISVGGGDRPSLTASNNVVKNNDIHDFSQLAWTYTPAVDVSGDGVSVMNNVLHDAPHSAILYSGSQHTISENEIYGVCTFSSDSGAIYSGRDWSDRGTTLEWNFIHDIASNMKGGYGVSGIYLDDCLSGIKVNGNVIYNVTGDGILHGGGRDNLLTGNVIVNAGSVLYVDKRCADAPMTITNVPGDSWNLLQKLEAVHYQSAPWSSAFPSCAAIPDDYATVTTPGSHWLNPEGCTFVDNLGFGYASWVGGDPTVLGLYATVSDNLQMTDPLFVNEANLDKKVSASKTPLALQPGSPVIALQGASATPFASIGILP